ncbi:MAG: hypothetical protein ACLPI9_06750 [Halobacteriota archaeon]|jgi:hypothetical protein
MPDRVQLAKSVGSLLGPLAAEEFWKPYVRVKVRVKLLLAPIREILNGTPIRKLYYRRRVQIAVVLA